jgi:hypothetical protein
MNPTRGKILDEQHFFWQSVFAQENPFCLWRFVSQKV